MNTNVVAIADKICELNLTEVVALNDLLKEKLNISDNDFGSGAMMVAPSEVNSVVAEVKTEFTLEITGYVADAKTKLIKLVKEIKEGETGSAPGLIEIKKMVEALPFILCEKINKEKSDKYSAMLKEIGVEFAVK